MNHSIIPFFLLVFILSSCQESKPEVEKEIKPTFYEANRQAFQKTLDNKSVDLFLIQNSKGMEATITNYGARIVSLTAPDRNGKYEDIVTGFKTLQAYLFANEKYFGATIGRYGNRIANGAFELDGQIYTIAKNNGDNNLHGGIKGFHAQVWDARQIDKGTLELKYFSKDTEEGFPGNLQITLTYMLGDDNELKIDYKASTDQKTIVNLTHHSFFNLAGEGHPSILNHELQINANHYTPVDTNLIPTGEIAPVEGTPFDFRTPFTIGARITKDVEQIRFGGGYDHNFVLNQSKAVISKAATVYEPSSGRVMEVFTNEPGLQFYSGNFLSGKDAGKKGKPYPYRSAFCLETQHYPNSPNQSNFPTTVLNPGTQYKSVCVYAFSAR